MNDATRGGMLPVFSAQQVQCVSEHSGSVPHRELMHINFSKPLKKSNRNSIFSTFIKKMKVK